MTLSAKSAFYFLSAQTSLQDSGVTPPGGSADDYLQNIEKSHGSLKENRQSSSVAISFDFYKAKGKLGSGFGVSVGNYAKSYSFDDGSSVALNVRSLLFTLTFYYRAGWWFPYAEVGTGNVHAKVKEILVSTEKDDEETEDIDESTQKTSISFIDSTPHTFHYGVGARFPIGNWGVLTALRIQNAPLKVQTSSDRIQLGGPSLILGGYYSF